MAKGYKQLAELSGLCRIPSWRLSRSRSVADFTILQIIPAQEQISTYSFISVDLCHLATLGHYPGKLHRLFWNMSIPPAPKLQCGYRFENIWSHFRLIYDCQKEKVFESPTGLEQSTSCPLDNDMPWLPLPGCAGDQNNLCFRWLHRTRTICK